jgi:hypothetical protein
MKRITLLTFGLCLLMASNLFAQTTYYVSAAGTNTDGLTLATAFTNFRTALDGAANGDTVIIDGAGGIIFHTAGSLTLRVDLTVVGQNSAILDGTNSITRLMQLKNEEDPIREIAFDVSNVTFQNFSSTYVAGVISVQAGGTLNVDNCVFLDNSSNGVTNTGVASGSGGAIAINKSHCTIKNSLFKGNSAPGDSGRGGAVYLYGTAATLSVSNATFYNNSTGGHGGAIAINSAGGSFEAVNITVANNFTTSTTGDRSGGIRFDNTLTTSIIKNSLIFDNTENGEASVMDVASNGSSKPTIDNSVIGIVSGQVSSGTVTNSVVNLASLVLDYVGIDAGTSNVVKYADTTHPVRFALASFLSPLVDQEGTTRSADIDGKIDAGAWESGFTDAPFLAVDSNDLPSNLNVFYSTTSKTIKIVNDSKQEISVTVFSVLGTKALSIDKTNNDASVDVSFLKSGVYILVATSSNGVSTTNKFVVN